MYKCFIARKHGKYSEEVTYVLGFMKSQVCMLLLRHGSEIVPFSAFMEAECHLGAMKFDDLDAKMYEDLWCNAHVWAIITASFGITPLCRIKMRSNRCNNITFRGLEVQKGTDFQPGLHAVIETGARNCSFWGGDFYGDHI